MERETQTQRGREQRERNWSSWRGSIHCDHLPNGKIKRAWFKELEPATNVDSGPVKGTRQHTQHGKHTEHTQIKYRQHVEHSLGFVMVGVAVAVAGRSISSAQTKLQN